MAWLADELPRFGLQLRRGDVVTTGVATDVFEVGAGESCVADFGPLGSRHRRLRLASLHQLGLRRDHDAPVLHRRRARRRPHGTMSPSTSPRLRASARVTTTGPLAVDVHVDAHLEADPDQTGDHAATPLSGSLSVEVEVVRAHELDRRGG